MDTKVITLGGKRFIVKKAPATVAYEVALRYRKAVKNTDVDEMKKCLYTLCKYVDVDLGDGRLVALDNPDFIDQHITCANDLITLQEATVEHNFGFFEKDAV